MRNRAAPPHPRIYRVPRRAQNQGYTLQFKCKEDKKQEMEYVAHITLLSNISEYRYLYSSLIVKPYATESQSFSIFRPLTKATSKM